MPMKITYIVPWFPSLDAKNPESQQGLFELRNVCNLSQRGNKFKVITIKWKGQSEYERINENIEVFRISHIFSYVRYPLPNFFKLYEKIVEISENWNPDIIVYSHSIFLTALPSLFLKNKLNKPTIMITDCIPGINWFYGNKIVDSVGRIHSETIGKKILKSGDGIHLLSSANIEYLKNQDIDFEKVAVITRGVNETVFKPRKGKKSLKDELGIEDEDTVILFVGRLDLVKGVDYLIKAAKKVAIDNDKVKFIIVGDGSLKPKYLKETKNYTDKIKFLGFRTDIPDLMNISDIFILTSLSEGACNVVLEASASGLPVIATKVGEVPEIIIDGETGILVGSKDTGSLVISLQKLINDPLLGKKMGMAGRLRIKSKYSEKIIYDKIENFYNNIIQKWKIKNNKDEI